MSSSIINGLLTGEEARINKLKPNSGTSVVIQDADGNDRLTVDGDGVTIAGTTTTVDVATVTVDDKNVELNAVASPTDANADGGGLTLKGSTDKTILWENDDDSWHFNQGVVVAGMAHATLVEGSLSQGNIQVGVDSGGDPGGELMFHTDDYVGIRCANSGALPLAVKPSGNVGIGTTEPAVALDVIGIGSFAGAEASLSQGNVQVGVDSGGDPGGELMFHTDDYVGIRCAHSGPVSLAVKPSGNVGIGVTDPDEQLELTGRVHLGQTTAPGTTTDKLYNVSGSLVWNGTTLGSGGDVSAGSTFTTANIIMVCDGDDKTIDEPSATISTNDQALTVGSNTGIRVGDGSELELSVEAGNDVVIRSHASNADVHFKVNDGGTNTTVMVLDGGDPAVHIKGGDVSSGILKIFEDSDNGTDAVSITVPASLAAAYTLTLPSDDGDSGEYLQTNGSGTLSWAAATGTDRMTITNRFRAGAFGATASTYFTGDVATDAGQFYLGSWSATHGSTVAVDSDWLSGFEVGPHWQAPRACTLTQICATSRINASTDCHSVNVHVFKATPVNNNASTTDIDMTLIGTAALTNDGSTQLTDYALQTINTAISSGNSVSANDVIVIGMQPVGGATSATSYFQVTLEFTVS